MPYKTLSNPRSTLDLGSEVRSSAALSTAGLVGMLATDPVRLGVVPASGSNGKITQVSLGNADEVAFLTKDVAVVRSGDDVWALLDITHTPKMDQVARDARALCHRPTGEVALALGWDGSATALTVSGHEVVARPFALRGTVRALDVGPADTYAIVDGAEGGELRVHPGPTPEPGASARAALPREAAKLDRLRGGKDLSVAWRAGSAAVCVVTRSGGKLSAKMVELEAAPIALEVSETSLLAAFADGRVALYDGEAIAKAVPAMQATHTLRTGARGEPRSLLVAGRSSPALWLGTAAGEILQLNLNRKTP